MQQKTKQIVAREIMLLIVYVLLAIIVLYILSNTGVVTKHVYSKYLGKDVLINLSFLDLHQWAYGIVFLYPLHLLIRFITWSINKLRKKEE